MFPIRAPLHQSQPSAIAGDIRQALPERMNGENRRV